MESRCRGPVLRETSAHCPFSIRDTWRERHEYHPFLISITSAIHNIESQRERNPSFEALYILQPNHRNVETIIQDFIDPQNKKYAAAHIFFISSLDNKSFSHISQSPMRPVIRSLVELNLDFNPIESMVFTTRTPDTFQVLYNPSCRSLLDSELALISKKVFVLGLHS